MRYSPLLSLLLLAASVTPVTAKWSRLPTPDKKPVGISMLSGTTVHSSKGVSQAGALILGDPMKPISLAGGKSEAILKFAKQSIVQSVSFVSDGLEGRVGMSISADGKDWNPLADDVFTPADRLVKLEGGAAQGRYLRFQFDLAKGGTIRGFQAIGGDTDANYKVTQSADGSGAPLNFAAGIGGGRLLYISPELYGNRGDALRSNRLEFPESDEKYRTAVYDLGQVRALNEFGSVHSPRPVRFSVYAFDSLPEKEDWRGRLTFDPTVFDSTEPVARAEDTSASGHLIAKPSKVVKARYVALRWEPDFNPPAFSAFSVSITGHATITYSGNGGVQVTTTENADGETQSVVTVDGNTYITITVDADGNVTISDAGPGAGVGVGGGSEVSGETSGEGVMINGVHIGAPSASGAGFGVGGTTNEPAASP